MEQGAVQKKRDGGDLSISFPVGSSESIIWYLLKPCLQPEVGVLQEFSCPFTKASVNKSNKSR